MEGIEKSLSKDAGVVVVGKRRRKEGNGGWRITIKVKDLKGWGLKGKTTADKANELGGERRKRALRIVWRKPSHTHSRTSSLLLSTNTQVVRRYGEQP